MVKEKIVCFQKKPDDGATRAAAREGGNESGIGTTRAAPRPVDSVSSLREKTKMPSKSTGSVRTVGSDGPPNRLAGSTRSQLFKAKTNRTGHGRLKIEVGCQLK